jgi:8-oxo-dGTP diphosphatase
LIETDEATPIWTDIPRIPYDEMWQDDPFWLPLVVKLTKFRGFFVFDREKLLSHRVDLL